jgi:hypothetical protein
VDAITATEYADLIETARRTLFELRQKCRRDGSEPADLVDIDYRMRQLELAQHHARNGRMHDARLCVANAFAGRAFGES